MMLNSVVNSRNFGWKSEELDKAFGNSWLYVGRGKGDLRPSVLGNDNRPWLVADAVAAYRVDLWTEMRNGNQVILEELSKVTPDTILVCHCDVAEKCHASVISKAARWLREGGFGS